MGSRSIDYQKYRTADARSTRKVSSCEAEMYGAADVKAIQLRG